jgi:hypothetical protein
MARGLALAVLAAVMPGCTDASVALAPEASTDIYPLRAVLADDSSPVQVPASIPSVGGADTLRYLDGEFELSPDGRWRERWQRAVISAGVERERRTFESGGWYRVVEAGAGRWVLDLYPGQRIPAVLAPTAVLRGDTLHHSGFVYAR